MYAPPLFGKNVSNNVARYRGRGEINRMKHLFLFISFFALVAVNLGNGKIENDVPLVEIVELMETNDIDVSEWRLYTRDAIKEVKDKKEYEQVVKGLKYQLDGFSWQMDEHDDHWKISATNIHTTLPIVEDITILAYPSRSAYTMYMIYELHGTTWKTEDWSLYSPLINERIEQLFPTPSPIFTTVTGKSGTIRKQDLYETATNLIEQLSSKKIEELNEETFVSLSAYNGKWNDSINSGGQKMNVQAALRHSSRMGGETTVTIGTPIITIEY